MSKKIAILTNFLEFNPSYSLSSIVLDQARMLVRHGHTVHIFVSTKFKTEYHFEPGIFLRPEIDTPKLIDYKSKADLSPEHKKFIKQFSKKLALLLREYDFIFTHDWIFTGWNMPYAAALMEIAGNAGTKKFYHWVHSIPSGHKDWWVLDGYGVKNHSIVYPNGSDAQYVALQFQAHVSHICPIPHIRDLRFWFDFTERATQIIDEVPGLMDAKFIQVYPASSDRLSAKRVDRLIKIFSFLKECGESVCLVIANQHANQKSQREKFAPYYVLAERLGLKKYKEFIFTSEFKNCENGLPKATLRDLMLCANVFIYPTRDESFGLVGVEEILSGAKIVILNKSLELMWEVHGGHGFYEDFGSFNWRDFSDTDEFYRKIARDIIKEFNTNESIKLATYHRQKHNMDAIYRNFYRRLLEK